MTAAYGTKQWFEAQFALSSETGTDQWGHQWRSSQRYRYGLSLELIRESVAHIDSQNILDIGCGLGDFTHLVFQLNTSNHLTGCDISENAINSARKKYPHLTFTAAALPSLEFDRQFHGIIALESVYYLNRSDRLKAVQVIAGHLVDNGWFAFSTVLDDGSTYFTENEAVTLLEQAGLSIEKKFYNHASLYTHAEHPFLAMARMPAFLDRISAAKSAEQEGPALSRKWRFISANLKIPGWGWLLKGNILLAARLSMMVLSWMWPVRMLQSAGRILKNRSHLLLLARKRKA